MSSSPPATADTPISLKVNLDGVTRRFKLPLRDLGVSFFEDKLRAYLQIPIGTATVIERYSDSATSYVTLSTANVSVYKQLYRAAKAKQKLKLRVTTKPIEPARESQAPKPATVEDEVEQDLQTAAPPATQKEPEKEAVKETAETSGNSSSGVAESVVAPRNTQEFPDFVKLWRTRGNPKINLRRNANGVEVVDFLSQPTKKPPVVAYGSRELEHSGSSTQFSNSANPPRESPGNNIASSKELETNPLDALRRLVREANPQELPTTSRSSPPLIEEPEVKESEVEGLQDSIKRPFTVCCNSCDRAVPEAHFHCSICDEGDFDLCQACVNNGISCYGDDHWLIRRTVVDGDIKCSTTHVAPKSNRPTVAKPTPKPILAPVTASARAAVASSDGVSTISPSPFPSIPQPCYSTDYNARTCNCCVREFREEAFVHCTTCDDYDLCRSCFVKNEHGHHPKHGFTAVVKGTLLDQAVSSQLAPGRSVLHNAICDGCDKYVRGIRHKCLDCPDWDYCSDCVKDAGFIHPNHRFVPIYEPLADRPFRTSARATHYGISCDGPLCSARVNGFKYITGERYKCAVCHDTDFCANCEASPSNTHNKTHPLIKFKTPVRHVSVTTTGEHEDGQRLPTMGDRCPRSRTSTLSPEKTTSSRDNIAATPVQTVVDVQPTEQIVAQPVPLEDITHVEIKEEASETKAPTPVQPPKVSAANTDLVAVFKWDTIQDGSVLPPNHTFEQTWVIRNEGTVPWPAGCAVKFVGGDYMGAVDPAHPAGIHELVSASESTVCYNALNPGQEFAFTVLMRTPDRDGKVISYWRLTTPDGVKFGHKLWCDVTVQASPKAEQSQGQVSVVKTETVETEAEANDLAPEHIEASRMIIPKLDHESPSASIHEGRTEVENETETETLAPSADEEDAFEDCGREDDWAEESDDGFLTDEEYDILDASDEEFLFEQQKILGKK
ncbi:hypothetical protein F4802DRAFT_608645 [Xylaria palmicola]|nr:hypothetical protein F4802DRAFT_608645 [Xylaria palmicola]